MLHLPVALVDDAPRLVSFAGALLNLRLALVDRLLALPRGVTRFVPLSSALLELLVALLQLEVRVVALLHRGAEVLIALDDRVPRILHVAPQTLNLLVEVLPHPLELRLLLMNPRLQHGDALLQVADPRAAVPRRLRRHPLHDLELVVRGGELRVGAFLALAQTVERLLRLLHRGLALELQPADVRFGAVPVPAAAAAARLALHLGLDLPELLLGELEVRAHLPGPRLPEVRAGLRVPHLVGRVRDLLHRLSGGAANLLELAILHLPDLLRLRLLDAIELEPLVHRVLHRLLRGGLDALRGDVVVGVIAECGGRFEVVGRSRAHRPQEARGAGPRAGDRSGSAMGPRLNARERERGTG
mmetsp:Transcript_7907/g.32563  ORF Transcript_7907/g.32563 Transcript_7907/m.32563 type:complete len:358 (+) Transcript_7907:3770-4843(+)